MVMLCVSASQWIRLFFLLARSTLIITQHSAWCPNGTPLRRQLSYFQFLVTHAYSVKEIRLFRLGAYFIERYKQLYHDFYAVDSQVARREMLAMIPFTVLTNAIAAGAQVYAIAMTIATNQLGFLA
ncbi:MAG: hypothetical protein ACRDHW_13690, partial [Ktedonobacteraceae bacterium]